MQTLDEVGKDIRELKSDVKELRRDVKELKLDVRELCVKFEVLEGMLSNALELLSSGMTIFAQVADHESRVGDVEADNRIVMPTVKLHTEQLKRLRSSAI